MDQYLFVCEKVANVVNMTVEHSLSNFLSVRLFYVRCIGFILLLIELKLLINQNKMNNFSNNKLIAEKLTVTYRVELLNGTLYFLKVHEIF